MSLQKLGKNISVTEITNVSSHGVWLFSEGRELFMSYEDFPWFKEASIGKIFNVKRISPDHFYWPDLDVDIGIETIEHPERFPLKAK